ncbi:unnamed protein product [Pseudo-nitzschia multistriata]|uniref:PrsW family intramembrane metalloprotease n=1 Tax=Pseudo-nitzschia multistriata TaxID=183589 RepID=A0A448ZAI9_9STRA|nr:unnamed protein product [Pseudo-nitzschia multistriata]
MVSTCDDFDDNCTSGGLIVFFLELFFVGYLIFLCCLGGKNHGVLRQAVHQKMRDQQLGGSEEQQTPTDISTNRKPLGCCSCYPYDVVLSVNEGDDPDDADDSRGSKGMASPDLSTCLFRAWSSFCCGALCQCWCQCCGMCAIGQEDRELELILEKDGNSAALHIDYITFQPYSEYFPAIRDLQNSREGSFAKHRLALSDLSKRILRYAAFIVLLYCALFIVSQEHYGIKIGVALGVWAQPCVVLYFVWWRWNRFDISLDAVIKYFASGYLIGMFQALIVETIIFIPYAAFMAIGIAIEIRGEVGQDTVAPATYLTYFSDGKNTAQMMKDYWGLNAIFMFVLAFVIAALVEEIVKYYCYWTLETPEQVGDRQKSKLSQANYITIGMVSAALGFACKENMQYVFQSKNVRDEILTLVLRSILAVHPVCAAIQSLGVVKRDIQGDPSSSLGRILFPAILLHGLFDFVELLLSYFFAIDMLNTKGTLDSNEGVVTTVGVGVIFMIVGLTYYFCRARQQRNELALSDFSEGTSSLELNPIL